MRAVEATGREIGRELAPADATGARALVSLLAALGFQPQVTVEADSLAVCLANCPYRDAAVENQATVCTLHRGITRGLLDVLEPSARLVSFEPRNPDEAGCLIRIAGLEVAAASALAALGRRRRPRDRLELLRRKRGLDQSEQVPLLHPDVRGEHRPELAQAGRGRRRRRP
jgi:hypothetical protein